MLSLLTFQLLSANQLSLRRIALLEDDTRVHFNIAAVTTGPKRSQKGQTIDDNGQGWTNPSWSESLDRFACDQVYRIKVCCLPESSLQFAISIPCFYSFAICIANEFCS